MGRMVLLACALVSCSPSPPATAPAATATAAASAPPSAAASAAPRASGTASAIADVPPPPPLPDVRLVAVDPTPFAGKLPVLGITAPSKGQIIPLGKFAIFDVKISANGWKPEGGDHLCLVVDRTPCRRVDDASKSVKLGDFGTLEEGAHTVSLLARRASGEFLRGSGKSVPFASVSFFVGKKGPSVHKDGAPMIFYSPLAKGPAPAAGVLLDFFVANAKIERGAFVVHATVGGPGIMNGVGMQVENDRPLRLQNARPGEYLSRFTLMKYVAELGESKAQVQVAYVSTPVLGPHGMIERSFVVER
jgi:hypothetical protein